MKRLVLMGLLVAASAQAQHRVQHYLPPAPLVQEVLLASPLIRSAQHRQQALEARAQQQAIGLHEFGVRISQQSRRVQDPSQSFGETWVALERPMRWWNKVQTDQQLSELSRTIAQVGYADALHEGSRRLLTHWITAWRARVTYDSAQEQWQLTQSLERQAAARLVQGDISKLDADLAQAASQRAGVQRDIAHSEWVRAQAVLTRLYPGLGTPGPLPEAMQLSPLASQDRLRADFLRKHHELNLMRAERARSALTAERQQQEQLPDPTVGVFSARKRLGAERVVGVSVGIPLPGASRQYLTAATQSEASAWEDRVRQSELDFGAEFDRRWLSARDLHESLKRMTIATQIQQQAARQALRAYTLGESSMTDVLQHRRWADEQQLAWRLMQLEVLELLAFIELDLHQLWDLD